MREKHFICPRCKRKNEHIGVIRKETHFYSMSLETGQWKDRGEETDSGEYYCLNCNKKIYVNFN